MDVVELNLRLERKVQQLQALIDFGRALAGVVEPGDVLRRFGLTLAGQWALRRWGVLAVREGREPLVAQRGLEGLVHLASALAGPGHRVFSEWRTPFPVEAPAAVPLLSADGDPHLPEIAALGVRAVVPLVSGETVLGFAALGERPGKAPWTEDDLEHAAGLASQAVVALEGTWQSQEASHWRRLSQAKDEWRQLDRTARLVFLAVARLVPLGKLPQPVQLELIERPEDAPARDPDGALRALLAEAGAAIPRAQVGAAVERLLASGALSRDREGTLQPEREAWLLLPEARLPLAEIAREMRMRVGAYELFERIGSGGMGDVYRAENVYDRSPAAVKLLPDRVGDDEDLRDRFEREGAIVSGLAHPNIVRLLARGEHEGRLFLAMELLDGEALSTRLRRGPMRAGEALAGIRDIASALSALHERDVVHRDVKTSNVMKTGAGRWVLLDFGLARSLLETTRTGQGSLVGTIPYMAPERIKGNPGGKSSDVWSLGIVFFQLLVGCFPWESRLNETLVIEITQSRPNVALWVTPAAGEEVARVVEAMLDPDPAKRIQDGGALLRALDRVKAVEPSAAGEPRVDVDGPQLVDSFDSRADTA